MLKTKFSDKKQKVMQLADELFPVAREYLQEEASNPDRLNLYIDYAKANSDVFPKHIAKKYCIACLLLASNSNEAELKRRGVEKIGDIELSDYLIRRINYIMDSVEVTVSQEPQTNATHELSFTFSAVTPEHPITFIGRVFHELEHVGLDIRYEIKIDEYGEFIDINQDSVTEQTCDLSNLVKVNENVTLDESYFFKTAKRLNYQDAFKKVHDEGAADGHYNARAVLWNIFEEASRHKDKLNLPELLKEIYYTSLIVLDEYRRQGTQGRIKFKDFSEDVIHRTNEFLKTKGLKIEIVGYTEQFACFDSSSVPKLQISPFD